MICLLSRWLCRLHVLCVCFFLYFLATSRPSKLVPSQLLPLLQRSVSPVSGLSGAASHRACCEHTASYDSYTAARAAFAACRSSGIVWYEVQIISDQSTIQVTIFSKFWPITALHNCHDFQETTTTKLPHTYVT